MGLATLRPQLAVLSAQMPCVPAILLGRYLTRQAARCAELRAVWRCALLAAWMGLK